MVKQDNQRGIYFHDWGLIPYQEAWDKQTDLFNEVVNTKLFNRKASEEDKKRVIHHCILCEHPHVYTLGRNGKEAHLLLGEKELEKVDASFVKINRGGDITYHGYGQLVGYPILDLDDFFNDIGRYIRYMEEVIIRILAEYGIKSERIEGLSGVWIDSNTAKARKICAVGVHLSRWVTMHGFAFNINTDLDYFNHIVPCGIDDKDKGVTSLSKELGRKVDMEEVKALYKKHFVEVYDAHWL